MALTLRSPNKIKPFQSVYSSANIRDKKPDPPPDITLRSIGNKQYELTNPLGNVLAVVTGTKDGSDADIVSLADYYPFGMDMPARNYVSEQYRYGYQGSERDPEMLGGQAYTTFFRALDPRLGRWFTPDPINQPWQSPYCSMDNNPIFMVDVLGDKRDDPKKRDKNGLPKNPRHGKKVRFKDDRGEIHRLQYDANVERWINIEMRTIISNRYFSGGAGHPEKPEYGIKPLGKVPKSIKLLQKRIEKVKRNTPLETIDVMNDYAHREYKIGEHSNPILHLLLMKSKDQFIVVFLRRVRHSLEFR